MTAVVAELCVVFTIVTVPFNHMAGKLVEPTAVILMLDGWADGFHLPPLASGILAKMSDIIGVAEQIYENHARC